MNDVAAKPSPTVVTLHAESGWNAPIGALTALLAEAVARDLDEPALLVRVRRAPEGEGPSPDAPGGRQGRGAATLVQVSIGAGERDATARVQEVLDARGREHVWAFLDLPPGVTARIDHGRGAARPVFLTRSARCSPGAEAAGDPLITEVLPCSALPRVTGLDAVRQSLFAPQPPRPRGGPWARGGPERCRVRLDLPNLGRLHAPSLADLGKGERASMGRWARALGRRRVGLALGGGGAFCLSHVALIEGLAGRGIPIDLVAGTSGGALVGAYYCALGHEGLDRLVARGRFIERSLAAAMISPAAIEWLVTHDLGHLALEELEVPLYPAATNLATGQREVMRGTSLGFGVRASGSAPGLFGATFAHGARYVDGAVGQNVPAPLARAMGAALVIAGNATPPPSRRGESPPSSKLGRLVEQVSPSARVRDFLHAFDLLCHEEGDVEAQGRTVLYSLAEHPMPMLESFGFGRARAIVEAAREDPALLRALDHAERAYRALVRPAGTTREPRAESIAAV